MRGYDKVEILYPYDSLKGRRMRITCGKDTKLSEVIERLRFEDTSDKNFLQYTPRRRNECDVAEIRTGVFNSRIAYLILIRFIV